MSSLMRTVRPGQFRIGNWIGIILILLIGAGVGGFFLIRSIYRNAVLSPFEASLPEFRAAKPSGAPTPQPFKGGVITIDGATDAFDYIFFDLPDDMKPADPAAVKTIVYLHWEKKQTHKYSNDKPGYTHFCNVMVVDRETKAFLGQQSFVGGPPPASIRSRSSSAEGSKPIEQIVQFLKSGMANP